MSNRRPKLRCSIVQFAATLATFVPVSDVSLTAGQPDRAATTVAIAFDSVSVSFSDPMGVNALEQIEIDGDGVCVYTIEGMPARGPIKERPPARQTCRISGEQLRRLERMLEKTGWLTAPRGDLPAPGVGEAKITLVCKGQTRTVTCSGHGQTPEGYGPMVEFFRGEARQENLLYQLRQGTAGARLRALSEIRRSIDALEGAWGQGYPPYDLDYSRYLPACQETLRQPDNRHPDEVQAAVRLAAFLRAESEFEPIARLAHHSDYNVRTQVARALSDFGGARAVPVLAEMAPKTDEAVWGLIRLSDVAVPAMVRMILRTNSYDDRVLSERIVRGYIDHWNELPGPVDQRIVAAARKALPELKPHSSGEYHAAFLEMVKSRPVPAGELACRIDGQTVYCPQPMRFIHGWYVEADGKTVAHGAAPAPSPGTKVFELKFDVAIDGNRLVIRTGWIPTRGSAGETPQPVVAETVSNAPQGTYLDVIDQSPGMTGAGWAGPDKPKTASFFMRVRVTTEYRTLWEGRLVKGGQTLKRIVYIARVSKPDDPAGEFKRPSSPTNGRL